MLKSAGIHANWASHDYDDLKQRQDEIVLFASITAHDLRAPLGNCVLWWNLFWKTHNNWTEKSKTILEKGKGISENALIYTDNVLSYARALQNIPTGNQAFALQDFLNNLIAMVDPNGKLSISLPHATQIECDITALQIILRNLIENASRHGGNYIHVQVEPTSDNNELMKFTVSDNGHGFEGGGYSLSSNIDDKAIPNRKSRLWITSYCPFGERKKW